MPLIYPASGSLLTPNGPVVARVLPILRTPWTNHRLQTVASRSGISGLPIYHIPSTTYRRGLAAGNATVKGASEIAGGAATAGIGIAAAAGSAAATAAIPIVGPIVALATLLASFIGGGCGQACINASQAQQIYEYAGQCLDAVAGAGMINQSELLAGLQNLLSAGLQHMQAIGSNSSDAKGTTTLQNALNQDISYAGTIPAVAPNPLNLAQAQALFPSTSGWYAGSAAAGAQLAVAYLQSLPATATATGSTASTPGTVTVLGNTFSTTELLLGAAALVGIYFFTR